ncbi:uncharacterized protein LOC128221816 [Mya arenaria]|uniref:uncharacterized protein LOC128221816 n=1 Tax=Mya arenaria TaxID=6604 RepID=UPI0022E71241|nr:uncharacterized protein LOC128221816 [Mya arenaria]
MFTDKISRFLLVTVAVVTLREVKGHGYMYDPPQRSSAWRLGFNTPVNYQDNELFCGGASVQWNKNGGNCGVCGDNYADVIKENEDIGGKYVTGTIVRSYVMGSKIDVTIKLTANHRGWWEFRLCPLRNSNTAVTMECLDQHVLVIEDESTRYDLVKNYVNGAGSFHVKLQLPDDVTCENCVLHWKYQAGNNWGCDETGCCVGCGDAQENFWNCADIRIYDDTTGTDVTSETTTSQTTTQKATTQHTDQPTTKTAEPTSTETLQTTTTTKRTTTDQLTTTAPDSTTKRQTTSEKSITTTTEESGSNKCRATSALSGASMDQWCETNCAAGYCPASHCTCTGKETACTCKAVWPYSANPSMKDWCCKNCALGNCPSSHCAC